MRIFGWAGDTTSGCFEYRIRAPFEALADLGHTVAHDTVLRGADGRLARTEAEILDVAADWDVIIGQRVSREGASRTWQRLARAGHKLVYEIDDDLLDVHGSNPAAALYGQPAVQERIVANMRVASLVTVSTDYLAERYAQFNPNIVVLPNCIDESLLTWPRSKNHPPAVGWAGSPTHRGDFEAAAPGLKRFFARHPDTPFFVGGHSPEFCRAV
jgi:hypothetical protein